MSSTTRTQTQLNESIAVTLKRTDQKSNKQQLLTNDKYAGSQIMYIFCVEIEFTVRMSKSSTRTYKNLQLVWQYLIADSIQSAIWK